MSPEQLTGETLTVQADIYSLGVLGYVLLTGEGPFAGGRANEVAQKLHGRARPLNELRPDVDPQLAAVLERCLARNPEHRPRAADVVRALSGEGAAALPAEDKTAIGAFLNELRRRKVYTVAAAYITMTLIVFGLMEGISDVFDAPIDVRRVLVVLLLAGFPVSLSLAWIFDVREGRVKRTPSAEDVEGIGATGVPVLPLIGLAISILVVMAAGWWILSNL
jgi:phage shock protein PspC (stress-responsive transcriptional regulator)